MLKIVLYSVLLFLPASILARSIHAGNSLHPQKINGLWGYADTGNNLVIKPQYDYAEDFSEGRAVVLKEGKWGFIDSTGRFIIKPVFDDADAFAKGRAKVSIYNKSWYIDNAGKRISPKLHCACYYCAYSPQKKHNPGPPVKQHRTISPYNNVDWHTPFMTYTDKR